MQCLDRRKLNSLLHIDGILTALDLKNVFWQIPLNQQSREKTGFAVPRRQLYHYTVMSFGLCNEPQTMSHLMYKVISPALRTELFVYLDVFFIVSDSFQRHLGVLRLVASKIKKSGLTINVPQKLGIWVTWLVVG